MWKNAAIIASLLSILPSQPLEGQDVWRRVESSVTVWLRHIAFSDSLTGWAIGDSAVLLRTVDGGEHWSRVDLPAILGPPLVWLRELGAAPDVLYLGTISSSGQAVWRYRPSSEAWTRLLNLSPSDSSRENIIDLSFHDAKHGVVVTAPLGKPTPILRYTSDGGNSWDSSRLALPYSRRDGKLIKEGFVNEIEMVSSEEAAFLGLFYPNGGLTHVHMIQKSVGDSSWVGSIIPPHAGVGPGLDNIYVDPIGRAYVAGTHLYRLTGSTLDSLSPPLDPIREITGDGKGALYAGLRIDTVNGIARSDDEGQSWQWSHTGDIIDEFAWRTPTSLFAVGYDGAILTLDVRPAGIEDRGDGEAVRVSRDRSDVLRLDGPVPCTGRIQVVDVLGRSVLDESWSTCAERTELRLPQMAARSMPLLYRLAIDGRLVTGWLR